MKKVGFGAAVAAGVMLCGWTGTAERAKAATLYNAVYDFTGLVETDGIPGLSYDLEFALSYSGTLNNIELGKQIHCNGLDFYVDADGTTGFFSVSGPYDAYFAGATASAGFTLTKASLDTYDFSGYEADYVFNFEGNTVDAEDIGRGSGTLILTPVPLPSSLLFFSASLITLCMFSVCYRQSRTLQAAKG